MITLNTIRKELIEGIETERTMKEFRKLNEFNAIMFELNTDDGINWIDKLLMFDHKFYEVLKKHNKTEERLLKVLEQNPAYFKSLKFDGTFSEKFIKNLMDKNNSFFDFDLADVSIKTNREIFSHALSSKKRYLTNELTEMVKNDIELYTKYLNHIYNYDLFYSPSIEYRWSLLSTWSTNFHGKEKPLLKKTENLEYFIKNYKGFYPKDLLVLMCSNKNFNDKINKLIDISKITNNEVVDYVSIIRQIDLLEKLQEIDKETKIVKPISVKKKI